MSRSIDVQPVPAHGGASLLRIAIVVGAAVVLLGSAAVAYAHGGGFPGGGAGMEMREGAGSVIGPITIKAINSSNLSLESADGWTRTIALSSSTTITKGDKTITAGDLKVGDHVRLRQTKSTDGTYAVTEVHVVLPKVVGTVTAKTSSTLTLLGQDGANATVHVGSGTTYRVRGVDKPGLDDITIGMIVMAAGTERSDGSLDADVVAAGGNGRGFGQGPGRGFGGWDKVPGASPAPSGTSSSTS